MIKAVIFDLDNTLVDLMEMKKLAVRASVDAMIDAGLDIEREKAVDLFEKMYMNFNIEDRKIFQKFLKKVDGKVDIRMLCYAILAYRRIKSGHLVPYPGARRTLLALKAMGLKLAIVSDAPRERGWLRVCATKLDEFFDVIVTFDDTKALKPSHKPFLFATKKLGISPAEALMVGDFPERDMMGAKALGMKTAFAKYGYDSYAKYRKKQKTKVSADVVLHKVSDLLDYVRSLKA